MIKYDSDLIYRFAERLYSKAARIVFISTIVGSMFGFIGCVGFFQGNLLAVLAGLVLGGVIGYAAGNELAFSVRLRAQLALCQVQIEENTRQVEAKRSINDNAANAA